MAMSMENQIFAKLNSIEHEIAELKLLAAAKTFGKLRKSPSIKGLAKPLVSAKELENAIQLSKKSLLKGG